MSGRACAIAPAAPEDGAGLAAVRAALRALEYRDLLALALALCPPGKGSELARTAAILAGWAGWKPPRAARVNPFQVPREARPGGVSSGAAALNLARPRHGETAARVAELHAAGNSVAEIAEALGKGRNAVHQALYAARRRGLAPPAAPRSRPAAKPPVPVKAPQGAKPARPPKAAPKGPMGAAPAPQPGPPAPLSEFQVQVLRQAIRDPNGGAPAIGAALGCGIGPAARAIAALRAAGYLAQGAAGEGAVLRPLRLADGRPVPKTGAGDLAAEIAAFEAAQGVTRCPPAYAAPLKVPVYEDSGAWAENAKQRQARARRHGQNAHKSRRATAVKLG